jgi:hypothetical protein
MVHLYCRTLYRWTLYYRTPRRQGRGVLMDNVLMDNVRMDTPPPVAVSAVGNTAFLKWFHKNFTYWNLREIFCRNICPALSAALCCPYGRNPLLHDPHPLPDRRCPLFLPRLLLHPGRPRAGFRAAGPPARPPLRPEHPRLAPKPPVCNRPGTFLFVQQYTPPLPVGVSDRTG